jgi:hypothetical protein
MNRTIVATALSLSLLGCSPLSPEGKQVRVTSDPEVVSGCKFVGNTKAATGVLRAMSASGEEQVERKLQNQAAAMGGNVLYLVSWDTGSVQGVAEVYRCAHQK